MAFLKETDKGLTLVTDSEESLCLNFIENRNDYLRPHRGASELIAKALGKSHGYKTVLDCTAGLAIDSIFMARLGFDVTAIERNEMLFHMLEDARARAIQYATNENDRYRYFDRLHFINGDSIEFLRSHDYEFEVIYVDPMYPEKKKSALPRKEMRLFRELVGEDLDADVLLREALIKAKHRVVVKRPVHAPALLSEEVRVTHQFVGKNVRFDMYQVGNR